MEVVNGFLRKILALYYYTYMLNNYSISTNNNISENKTAIWSSFRGSVYNVVVFFSSLIKCMPFKKHHFSVRCKRIIKYISNIFEEISLDEERAPVQRNIHTFVVKKLFRPEHQLLRGCMDKLILNAGKNACK